MRDKEKQLEQLLIRSLKTQQIPPYRLQEQVRRAIRRHAEKPKKLSLWFLPMLLNSIFFLVVCMGIWAFLPYTALSRILMAFCLYFVAAGIVLTIAGLKFADLKEKTVIERKRKGEGL